MNGDWMVAAFPALREINAGNLDVDFVSWLLLGLYIFSRFVGVEEQWVWEVLAHFGVFPHLSNLKISKLKN